MKDIKYVEAEKLEELVNDMHRCVQPIAYIEEISAKLSSLILQAEEKQNWELIQIAMKEVIPVLNEINFFYEQVYGTGLKTHFEGLNKKIQELNGHMNSLFSSNFVHIASDTIGNTGDYILVRGVRKLLENENGGVRWIKVGVRDAVTPEFIKMCNLSNALVIGGGGLFLKDSNPNHISGWQWACRVSDLEKIEVPIYVVAVGYNRFRGQEDFDDCFKENLNVLVEKSSFFGMRNHGSICAIKKYLKEELWERVVWQPCPTTVLSKLYKLPERNVKEPFIALNCAFDREQLRYQDKKDEVMRAVARVVKRLSQYYKIKYYIQCEGDELALEYLDELQVAYERIELTREMDEEEFLNYYVQPELMIAMRGHAQMIPFGCKTPVISLISHDKLKWFLEDIEHPEWGIEVLDNEFEEKLTNLVDNMLQNRKQICQEIAEAQEKLWKVTQENLQKIKTSTIDTYFGA